jgi:hypothetical protein
MYNFLLATAAGLFGGYWITDQGLGLLGPLFSLAILVSAFIALTKTK